MTAPVNVSTSEEKLSITIRQRVITVRDRVAGRPRTRHRPRTGWVTEPYAGAATPLTASGTIGVDAWTRVPHRAA